MNRNPLKIGGWGFVVAALLIISGGCASHPPSPAGTKPIITHAFLPREQGRFGEPLRIFIEAEDPQGFMFRIYTVVEQPGYGLYFPDIVQVKPENQHQLRGYLQWNTSSSCTGSLPEWTNILMRISIVDTAGNESNTLFFPFTFVSEAVREQPLPPPFDQGNMPRLGHIFVNLCDPTRQGDGNGSFRF